MTKDFHPGVGGPYNGYCDNVDVESKLFNRFMTLQKCGKNSFILCSNSDFIKQPFKQKQILTLSFNITKSR